MRNFLIPLSIAFSNPKILGFLFLQKRKALPGDWNANNWTLENRREFIWYALKIVHKWNGHLGIASPNKRWVWHARMYPVSHLDYTTKFRATHPATPQACTTFISCFKELDEQRAGRAKINTNMQPSIYCIPHCNSNNWTVKSWFKS